MPGTSDPYPQPLALDSEAPAPGPHIWAPKELLCSAQHPMSFLRAQPGSPKWGVSGASLLPLECNKGSNCVSCSPSSGVVVGLWTQGPLSPGRFSLGRLEKWIHVLALGLAFSLSLLWPQLDSPCCLYKWADGLCSLAGCL